MSIPHSHQMPADGSSFRPLPPYACVSKARIPTPEGIFTLFLYQEIGGTQEHLALCLGNYQEASPVLTRLHSECFTGDVLGSLRCDCGAQLAQSMEKIAAAGAGVILYLRQEGRGIGLAQKLRAYTLQDQGYDTVDANLQLGHQPDEREYSAAAAILHDLGVTQVRLLTNNPHKIEALRNFSIQVVERMPLQAPVLPENAHYLDTKVRRMRHLLDLDLQPEPPVDEELSDPRKRFPQIFLALRSRAEAHWRQTGRPYTSLSYAQSLDGSITAEAGRPFAISSAASLLWTHALRASHDGILVGIGTLLADDPSLTVRTVAGTDPVPIVVDGHLRLPPSARIFELHPRILVATTPAAPAEKRVRLSEKGVTILDLPATDQGRVDLYALWGALGQEGIRSVMVEGGAQIITEIWARKLAQQAVITVAPILLGGLSSVQQPLFHRQNGSSHSPRLLDLQTFRAQGDTILWGAVG